MDSVDGVMAWLHAGMRAYLHVTACLKFSIPAQVIYLRLKRTWSRLKEQNRDIACTVFNQYVHVCCTIIHGERTYNYDVVVDVIMSWSWSSTSPHANQCSYSLVVEVQMCHVFISLYLNLFSVPAFTQLSPFNSLHFMEGLCNSFASLPSCLCHTSKI